MFEFIKRIFKKTKPKISRLLGNRGYVLTPPDEATEQFNIYIANNEKQSKETNFDKIYK